MSLRDSFYKIYDSICGKLPNCNILHYCWLGTTIIHKDLKRVLPTITGKVIDIGCGDKPYKSWTNAKEYIGLDVYEAPEIDVVVPIAGEWPLPDNSFDCVISTQSLEHVTSFEIFQSEIKRILKPGGDLIITMPFIAYEHATPYDFRRFTYYGMKEILKDDYDIVEINKQGRFGSTIGFLTLGFIFSLKPLRVVLSMLFPFWILFSLFTNLFCLLIDRVDNTGYFYSNVFIHAKRKNKN